MFRLRASLCISIVLRFEIPREGHLHGYFPRFQTAGREIACFLLRAAIGVTAVGQGAIYLSHAGGWTFELLLSCALLLAGGFCLLIGFLTPLVAALIGIAVGECGLLAPARRVPLQQQARHSRDRCDGRRNRVAGSRSILGDARLFGRREIVIPAGSSTPKSPLPPVS